MNYSSYNVSIHDSYAICGIKARQHGWWTKTQHPTRWIWQRDITRPMALWHPYAISTSWDIAFLSSSHVVFLQSPPHHYITVLNFNIISPHCRPSNVMTFQERRQNFDVKSQVDCFLRLGGHAVTEVLSTGGIREHTQCLFARWLPSPTL